MSEESKFLKYQDKNGDGLIDACEDESIIKVSNCPSCKRNPSAVVPKWKKRDEFSPWFNDKYCTFQITIVTTKMSLIPHEGATDEESEEYIKELFYTNARKAVHGLLDGFNKEESSDTVRSLMGMIQHTKYDLGVRVGSRVKLLYTLPYDAFAPIEERDTSDDEKEDTSEAITVTYDASGINEKLLKFRKAMYMYSRYYRVYQALENGSFIFVDSGKVFTKTQFDRYGDLGFFLGSSRTKDVLSDLDNWLNDRGMNIFGVGTGWGWFRERVTKLEFSFTKKMKLKKLKVWTSQCTERPRIYRKKRLRSLNNKAAWKDPTALGYFAKLHEIDNFLSARVERPWIEFVETFTFPKVTPEVNYPSDLPEGPETIGSCIVDALAEEGKQLGQDILDDVFSIGDAIAYTFHRNVCQKTSTDVDDERTAIGLAYKPSKRDPTKQVVDFGNVLDKSTGETKNVFGMATEQAFQQLYTDEQIFVQLCARMLSAALPFPGGGDQMIHDMYKMGLSRIKICGLLDLMIDAIQCLFKGLSLEDALSSAIKAALNAMSIENFGDLFIGLPPEKQNELEDLVKKKLENNDIFSPGSAGQNASDSTAPGSDSLYGEGKPFIGKIKISKIPKPWENQKIIDAERSSSKEGNYGTFPRPKNPLGDAEQKTRRTLAQQFDVVGASQDQLDPNIIMQAYVMALIEVYGDNLLGLTDLLNKYPGAQIIANIIALVDCPQPPMFDPNFFDFIKSLSLPFCRNITEIKMFRLENPFGWLPYFQDIPKLLFEALLMVLQALLIKIIMRLLVKLCEIIGDAICKALEITGDLALAVPDMIAGRRGFFDVIKESICGPEADDDQVNATIAEMFEKLGVGGAALADTQAVQNFAGDIGNSTTRQEMIGAFLGDASNDFLDITFTILENQYPQFIEGLPTKQHLGDFFSDMGNLFPADIRAALAGVLDAFPDNDDMPANPSLCATPEDLDNFKERRCLLLEGRATPAQCRQMFADLQNETLEDLDELTQIMHGGIPQMLEDALPPIVSQPGCDDGLIPFESEETQKAVGFALGGGLKQLQIDFAQDMLGDGDFGSGEAGWGFLNMVLSDTHGNPYTTHQEKVASWTNNNYVDFAASSSDIEERDPYREMSDFWQGFFVPSTDEQYGQYPAYVAEWLWERMVNEPVTFLSNVTYRPEKIFYKTFDELGWEGWFWTNINLLELPDFGWNVDLQAQMGSDRLKIIKSGRKKTPDLSLSFTDNHGGYRVTKNTGWSWGFDLDLFLGETKKDLVDATVQNRLTRDQINFEAMAELPDENDSVISPAEAARQTLEENLQKLEALRRASDGYKHAVMFRPGDNVRMTIFNKHRDAGYYGLFGWNDQNGKALRYRKYEFYTIDDTLEDMDTSEYPEFNACFVAPTDFTPQVTLLAEMIGASPGSVKRSYDQNMSSVFKKIKDEITGLSATGAPTKPGWMYGAKYDDLTLSDLTYVVNSKQTLSSGGTEYSEAEVAEYDEDGKRDGERDVENDDMILGISRMQFEEDNGLSNRKNRIFYLDPSTYGGTYMNPKIYITPLQNDGWRGFVDVVFPEISACKPSKKNMVEFSDIAEEIADSYNTIPEDQRLKETEYCAVEVPYNRILDRASKGGIQGTIKAACRIYATTHMMKSLATFTTFAPKFPETYSSLYAALIVEDMEYSFKDPGGAWWEWFLSFKDEEFWYAFLEQSVQTYARLVDDGSIMDPPQNVLEALYRINDMQEKYSFPYDEQLDAARSSGRAEPWPWDTLSSYRYEENLNAVRASEDDAKLILKEMVMAELNEVGQIFIDNMGTIGMAPDYTDMDYYAMSNLSDGALDLDLDKEIKETTVGAPTSGSNHYTNGDELSDKDGVPYIGYYHVHEDMDGNKIYMEGEVHTDESHGELTLFANKIIVPIGDIAGYGEIVLGEASNPFVIQKYTSINGTKYSPADALSIIKSNDGTKNISDIYPGTLEHVHFQPRQPGESRGDFSSVEPAAPINSPFPGEQINTDTRVVGLKGELGVRHGISFSVKINDSAQEVVSVEIDALDVKISNAVGLEGNSKLLLCLINKLKEHDKYKLLVRYIFPLSKATATWAIYNDHGFLPAIGEKTVSAGGNETMSLSQKPGMSVNLSSDGGLQSYGLTPGWELESDRQGSIIWPFSWFVNDNPWDSWDKELLRNSKSRVKNQFKRYYHSRDFKPWNDGGFNPGAIILKNLKASFAIPPLAGQMPWWSRRNLISNPFDANGNMCKK